MNLTLSDQLSLYYECHGDPTNPPIVLIHGIGADHTMWRPQLTSFPKAGYFVIVPDLRGHGQSAVPETFRISDCAHDIKELLDALDIKQAHLVGVSMGGMIAQQFVADYPERAHTQTIVDSLSGVSTWVERFNATLAAVLLKLFPTKLQAYLIRSTYKRMGHEEVGRYFEDCLKQMDARWLLAARQAVNRFDIFEALPHMTTPTLVLVGDGFGQMAIKMAHTTAAQIPQAQFHVLEGGGDPSNLLVPALFDQMVLNFIKQSSQNEKPNG